MNAVDIQRSIDGMVTEILSREKRLRELWRQSHLPEYYQAKRLNLYAKAVALIREIKKLKLIIADMYFIQRLN